MTIELEGKYYIQHLKKTNTLIHSRFSMLGKHHAHLNAFIVEQVEKLPEGSSILDGGCGLSIWVTDAVRRRYNILSMDCQPESIAFCRSYYDDNRYFVGDLYDIPLQSNSVDAVVLREVIEHIKEPERAVLEIKRVLKSSGRIILTTPNYTSLPLFLIENIYNRFFSEIKPYLDDVHPSKFKFHQLRLLLEKHFSVLEYGTIDFGINLKAVAQKA